LLRRPVISLNEQGVITDIQSAERIDSLAATEFYGGVLIPAMTNAHCHLELSALAGAIPPGGGLAAFARAMGGVKRDTTDRARAIALQDALMWQQGVAAVADVCNGDATFDVKRRSPVRYLSLLELFGMNTFSTQHIEELAAEASAAGLRWNVTPHATYSLQRESFAAAVALGEGPLSIHFMESPDERELFEGRGPLWDWYASKGFSMDFLEYGSPAGRVIAQVPADRDIMLIHNTYIEEEDVQRLTAHFGPRVTFVLCPASNRYISGARPPVEMLRGRGVRIALGTDSLASNDALSMAAEMRLLDGVPTEDLLRWATSNGAEALGIDDNFGSLAVGKAPGLAIIENLNPETLQFTARTVTRRLV
jgi:cytosine/adenosine deaminase-related metal-dependent hydrolase